MLRNLSKGQRWPYKMTPIAEPLCVKDLAAFMDEYFVAKKVYETPSLIGKHRV